MGLMSRLSHAGFFYFDFSNIFCSFYIPDVTIRWAYKIEDDQEDKRTTRLRKRQDTMYKMVSRAEQDEQEICYKKTTICKMFSRSR